MTVPKKWKTIFILSIVAALFFAAMTAAAFSKPATVVGKQETGYCIQSIEYSYRVFPTSSVLYPEADPLPQGLPSYFFRLTDKIEVTVKGSISTDADIGEKTDFQVKALVRSEEQWEKEINLNHSIENFVDEKGALVFQTTFNLPLSSVQGLVDKIVEETGVHLYDGYNIVLVSTIHHPPLEGGSITEDRFSGELQFKVDPYTIKPQGELVHVQEDRAEEELVAANRMNIFGLLLKVSLGRVLFASLMLLFAGAAAFSGTKIHSREKKESAEALLLKKIDRRYGRRIIKVGEFKELPPDLIKVKVDSFEELVKIADERERPILQVARPRNDKNSRFFLVDEKTLYYFSLPKKPSTGSRTGAS